jgi:hypothetical protein
MNVFAALFRRWLTPVVVRPLSRLSRLPPWADQGALLLNQKQASELGFSQDVALPDSDLCIVVIPRAEWSDVVRYVRDEQDLEVVLTYASVQGGVPIFAVFWNDVEAGD